MVSGEIDVDLANFPASIGNALRSSIAIPGTRIFLDYHHALGYRSQ